MSTRSRFVLLYVVVGTLAAALFVSLAGVFESRWSLPYVSGLVALAGAVFVLVHEFVRGPAEFRDGMRGACRRSLIPTWFLGAYGYMLIRNDWTTSLFLVPILVAATLFLGWVWPERRPPSADPPSPLERQVALTRHALFFVGLVLCIVVVEHLTDRQRFAVRRARSKEAIELEAYGRAPELTFRDEEGRVRARLSLGSTGKPSLELVDETGKTVWSAP